MTSIPPSVLAFRPDILLRIEGLACLVLSCVAYQHLFAENWGLFFLLFLFPDVALLAYIKPSRNLAPALYNTLHTYSLPIVLGLATFNHGRHFFMQLALIWISHIGFDRFLGYGLKSPGAFKTTHIQKAAL